MNKSKSEQLKDKYKYLFNDDTGKDVLEDLCKRYWIETSTYNTDSTTDAMLFKEGQRSVMLYILNQLKTKEK